VPKYPTAHTESKPEQPPQKLLFAVDYDRKPKPAPLPPSNASSTSKAAAEAIRNATPTLRSRVFEAICRAPHGLTRHEIADVTEIELATVCPRVGELLKASLIIESGTRPSPSGNARKILIPNQK
jgi:hypothetical protein